MKINFYVKNPEMHMAKCCKVGDIVEAIIENEKVKMTDFNPVVDLRKNIERNAEQISEYEYVNARQYLDKINYSQMLHDTEDLM